MKKICLVVLLSIIVGCASFGQFTPKGGAAATKAVTVAQGLLHALNGFYGDLLALKVVPDYTVQATRALSIADIAAAGLRAIIAGATVTDEQLNVLAGQVDGSRLILQSIKQ